MIAPRLYSNLPLQPRIRPSDGLPAAGVVADPTVSKSIIGIAFPYTQIGGSTANQGSNPEHTPPEVVWRIVLDRCWSNGHVIKLETKQTLEGRYVLRDGEFVELAETAY